MLKPIEDPDEMGSTVESAAGRVGLAPQMLADALASFVRSILSGNSRLDRYLYGEPEPLASDERLGLDVFNGSCAACHSGPTFSDERFLNTGVAYHDHRFQDDGRFEVTGRESDRGAFKTPTLRDVALTAPYMHDGRLATLQDVIEFYSEGGRPNPNLDINVRPLNLTTREKAALVAMLHTLTGAPRQGILSAHLSTSGRSTGVMLARRSRSWNRGSDRSGSHSGLVLRSRIRPPRAR